MTFYINETCNRGYSPYDILLDDTDELNEIADKIQKAKGKLPLFNYEEDEEYDGESWYNFFLTCDEDGVSSMYFEYGDGAEYCDEIPLTEKDKKDAFDAVLKFFGGIDEYKEYIKIYG